MSDEISSPGDVPHTQVSSTTHVKASEEALLVDAKTEVNYFQQRFGNSQWRAILASARLHMKTDRVNVAAQAFAYRWFLSIFPTIIALLGVASLVTVPQSVVIDLIHGVTRALPSGASDVFTKAITHATRQPTRDLFATILASLVAIWSAVSGMVVVQQGLDVAYGLPTDRSFLGKRALGVVLLVGAILLGGAASALVVFGAPIGKAIKSTSIFSADTFSGGWTALRWIIALVFINLLFTMFYNVAPNRPHIRWRWTSAGALVATFLWALVSLAFSLYTTDFSSYSKTYGAFAGVAILIFWLYLTGLAILLGGEINGAIERVQAVNNAAVESKVGADSAAAESETETR
jgi:membrane protein